MLIVNMFGKGGSSMVISYIKLKCLSTKRFYANFGLFKYANLACVLTFLPVWNDDLVYKLAVASNEVHLFPLVCMLDPSDNVYFSCKAILLYAASTGGIITVIWFSFVCAVAPWVLDCELRWKIFFVDCL